MDHSKSFKSKAFAIFLPAIQVFAACPLRSTATRELIYQILVL